MKKIRAIIADDEPLAREKLRMLLAAQPDLAIAAECSTVAETIEAVDRHRPALLFLDIQMPDGDGFDALRALEPEVMPFVLFTTAYDQYALRAFEAQAFDYLLKPFDHARFALALERVRARISADDRAETGARMIELLGALARKARPAGRLAVKSAGRIVLLNVTEIDWLEAASNYVRLHTGATTYLLRGTLTESEARLDPRIFLRIHRSIIVNMERIREVRPCNSGEFIVTLRGGKELPASRSYRSNLEPLLAETL